MSKFREILKKKNKTKEKKSKQKKTKQNLRQRLDLWQLVTKLKNKKKTNKSFSKLKRDGLCI